MRWKPVLGQQHFPSMPHGRNGAKQAPYCAKENLLNVMVIPGYNKRLFWKTLPKPAQSLTENLSEQIKFCSERLFFAMILNKWIL